MTKIYVCEYCGKAFSTEAECQEHENKCSHNPHNAFFEIDEAFRTIKDVIEKHFKKDESATNKEDLISHIFEDNIPEIFASLGYDIDVEKGHIKESTKTNEPDSNIEVQDNNSDSEFYLNGKRVDEQTFYNSLKDAEEKIRKLRIKTFDPFAPLELDLSPDTEDWIDVIRKKLLDK